ncbi:MAG: dockerin type I repeat-containing protein [Ruminococcus sp.]|nr:dockerin type I repeat-containing protein [Ruminococcus sp.]
MKNHHKLTAGIMSAVIAASSITMSVVFAQGRVSTPDIPRSSVGALYESETFSKTLTPPSKTVYEQGEPIDFSDFEIGTIRMTQTIVDGEVKDKYERIAYWVNWLSGDSYFFTDAKGNKYDSNKFSTLPAGKYTVTLAKTIEFSETKDHAEKIMLGGVDYEYEITIKAASQPQTTTATVVTTTATQTTSSNMLWMTTTVYVWPETSVTTSASTNIETTDTATTTTINYPTLEELLKIMESSHAGNTQITTTTTVTTSDLLWSTTTVPIRSSTTDASPTETTIPETTTEPPKPWYYEEFHPHAAIFLDGTTIAVGQTAEMRIYELTDGYGVEIEDESIVSYEELSALGRGVFKGLKPGTTNVKIYAYGSGNSTYTFTIYDPKDPPKTTTTTTTTKPGYTGTITTTGIGTLGENDYKARKYGDANCDGDVTIADAVLVLQSLTNPSKFGVKGTDPNHLTYQGRANADVDEIENGLSAKDALVIQKYKLGLITEINPWLRG